MGEDVIYYVRVKAYHEKASFPDTCEFNIVTQIFFSIEQPTMDHENMHKKCCKYAHHLTYYYSQKLTSQSYLTPNNIIGEYTNRENVFLISIGKPTIPNICEAKKSIVENMDSCFHHHSKCT